MVGKKSHYSFAQFTSHNSRLYCQVLYEYVLYWATAVAYFGKTIAISELSDVSPLCFIRGSIALVRRPIGSTSHRFDQVELMRCRTNGASHWFDPRSLMSHFVFCVGYYHKDMIWHYTEPQ